MKVKNEKVVIYNRDGKAQSTQVCTGGLTPLRPITEDEPYEADLCNVCDTDLFFTSDVTKRIAILNGKGDEVTGWVCPTCYTEFDNKDNIQVLMSKTSVQGKA